MIRRECPFCGERIRGLLCPGCDADELADELMPDAYDVICGSATRFGEPMQNDEREAPGFDVNRFADELETDEEDQDDE